MMNPGSDNTLAYRPLVRRTQSGSVVPKPRCWIGNDVVDRHYHNAIPANPESILIHLSWKPNSRTTPTFVGCYELNLAALLDHGFIRKDRQPGKVRLRFFHDYDDVIYIQVLGSKLRLEIGRFSPTTAAS